MWPCGCIWYRSSMHRRPPIPSTRCTGAVRNLPVVGPAQRVEDEFLCRGVGRRCARLQLDVQSLDYLWRRVVGFRDCRQRDLILLALVAQTRCHGCDDGGEVRVGTCCRMKGRRRIEGRLTHVAEHHIGAPTAVELHRPKVPAQSGQALCTSDPKAVPSDAFGLVGCRERDSLQLGSVFERASHRGFRNHSALNRWKEWKIGRCKAVFPPAGKQVPQMQDVIMQYARWAAVFPNFSHMHSRDLETPWAN